MFLKRYLKDFFCLLSLAKGKLQKRKAGVPILMYHSVGENDVFFTVSPAAFRRQMQYLKDNHYHVISLADLVDVLRRGKPFASKTVVLTFDDGYEDNYREAWPVLREHNFPATIFLVPRLIGKDLENSQGSALPLLNWLQIKEMHHSGLIDFEPHGLTHIKLNRCSPVQAKAEIGGSKEVIEKALNKKCVLFSYPKGGCNQGVVELIREEGFAGAVTLEKGQVLPEDSLFTLKRCSVNSTTSFIQFRIYVRY